MCEQTVAASQEMLNMQCPRECGRKHAEVLVCGNHKQHLASQRDAATWYVPPQAKDIDEDLVEPTPKLNRHLEPHAETASRAVCKLNPQLAHENQVVGMELGHQTHI